MMTVCLQVTTWMIQAEHNEQGQTVSQISDEFSYKAHVSDDDMTEFNTMWPCGTTHFITSMSAYGTLQMTIYMTVK